MFFVTLNYNALETYLFVCYEAMALSIRSDFFSSRLLTFVTGRTKQNGQNEGHKFIISYYNCQVLPSLNKVLLHSTKGNFPLAENNKMSGKCFSHAPRGAWL